MTLIKYNESVEKIKVTEDMRARILSDIPEKIKEPEKPLKTAPGRQISIYALIVPIITAAAAALLVWMILPQLLAGKGGSSSEASADQAATIAAVAKEDEKAMSDDMAPEANEAAEGGLEHIEEAAETALETGAVPAEAETANSSYGTGLEETMFAEEMTGAESTVTAEEITEGGGDPVEMITAGSPGEVYYNSVNLFKASSPLEGALYPSAALVEGREVLLENYVSEWGMAESDLAEYDDRFFAENDLIIALVEEPSGSITLDISGVTDTGDGTAVIEISENIPEIRTDDMAWWYVLIEVGKGSVGDNITLYFN